MKKRFLSMLLAVLMVLTLLPTAAFADGELSGKCGDNVTWKLEGDTLTISGTGPMFDYNSYNGPWDSTRMDIKSIVVGEGVTTIGNSAFEGCSKVTSVSLPKTLTRIGGHAFDHCSSLKELSIPDGVTSIGGYAFSCCTFESIKLPSGLKSLGVGAFAYCAHLKEISIPNGVKSLEVETFQYCTSLENVELPNGMTSIGGSAFTGCKAITSIVIPDSVTSIGEYAFEYCLALESIKMSNSLTNINQYAFKSCRSLKEIHLPASLRTVHVTSFFDCGALESIYYGGSIRQWKEGVTFTGSVEYDDANDGLVNAVIYIDDESDPFTDVKKGDPFYDEIFWAYGNNIINGDGTGNYNPNDGITRAQIVMILWNAAGNEEASRPSGFADVKDGAWYAKAVAWAVENGITNGTDLGFEPDRVCTRAEIVTFLHRVNNEPAPTAAASFTDLTQDWYKDAVAWAVENGITKGVGDNRFAPNDTCTRGQAAAFIYRLAQLAK